ncbi:MAG: hypothetical protein AAF199_09170 [Pseudomonadota bacterium]
MVRLMWPAFLLAGGLSIGLPLAIKQHTDQFLRWRWLYIPFFIGAIWVGSPVWCLILLWPVHFLVGIHLGPGFALAQTLAPVNMRALSTAVYFFILNLIALGLGPSVTGFLSDLFAGMAGVSAERGLRLAMTATLVPVIIGIFAFWRVTKTVDHDWKSAVATTSKGD